MAMGIRRPGFQLLSIPAWDLKEAHHDSHNIMDRHCLLPDQIRLYLWGYIPSILFAVAFLAYIRLGSQNIYTAVQNWEDSDDEAEEQRYRTLLPTRNLRKEAFQREGRQSQRPLLKKAFSSCLPSRRRIHLLLSFTLSRRSRRSRTTLFLSDILKVAYPILLVYFVVTLFVLW